MRLSAFLLPIACTAAMVGAANAQAQWRPEFSSTPAEPRDRIISTVTPTIDNHWVGAPWWKALGFCSGYLDGVAGKTEGAATAQFYRNSAEAGWQLATTRLMQDRGLPQDDAEDMVAIEAANGLVSAASNPTRARTVAAQCVALGRGAPR